jgi:hypothetical protein
MFEQLALDLGVARLDLHMVGLGGFESLEGLVELLLCLFGRRLVPCVECGEGPGRVSHLCLEREFFGGRGEPGL